MHELKPLSRDAVPRALERAERYRLLNEPGEAESICLDILAVQPEHAEARVHLILAMSDQLDEKIGRFEDAMVVVGQLTGYERSYYEGIVCERRAKAHHRGGGHLAGNIAHDWFRRAMACFEAAAAVRPAGNEDALLRWNTCARALMRHAELVPRVEERSEPVLE